MTMESLQDRLIRHEGFFPFPRPDNIFHGDNYVIGFGHDLTPDQAQEYVHGINYAEALDLLEKDIAIVKAECGKYLPWALGLDDVRQSVLYEMVYQLGLVGVQMFQRMLAACREGDWPTAAKEMLNSKWHKETPSRCEELAEIMLNGNTTTT